MKNIYERRARLSIEIQNASGIRLPPGIVAELEYLIAEVAGAAHPTMRAAVPEIVTLRFVGDAEMKLLNAAYKGTNRTTDVLAFETGDIAVCVDAARRQCGDEGHSLRRELMHLSLHGVLHLMGMTDDTKAERDRMNAGTSMILDLFFDMVRSDTIRRRAASGAAAVARRAHRAEKRGT